MKNQKLLIGATISVLLGAMLYFFVIRDKSADQSNQSDTNQNTSSDSSEDSDDQNAEDSADPSDTDTENTPDQPDDDETEEPKTPPVSVNVKEKPVLTNSSGNTAGSAAPANALVSSSCATDAHVECTLTFTNTSTGEVVTFDAEKTDSQGIAVWEWTAGDDVGSGTWEAQASAGSKTSDVEVVYVQ